MPRTKEDSRLRPNFNLCYVYVLSKLPAFTPLLTNGVAGLIRFGYHLNHTVRII